MALENRIRAINWRSNVETIKNVALSGKRYTADFGHQFWSFTIQTPPLTRTQFQDDFAVLFNDTETGATIDVKPGILHDGKGRVSATVQTSGTFSIAQVAAMGDNIQINLDDTSGAGMLLTYGDFLQFGTHKKIYMINDNNVPLDPAVYGGAPTGTDRVYIFPPFIEPIANNTSVKFNDLSVQVIAIGETNSFSTNQDGLFVFEKEVREVF